MLEIGFDPEREQILGGLVAQMIKVGLIVGACMAHHDHRWVLEAIYQKSTFLIDGEVEWPAYAACAFRGQPFFGGAEQG